MLEKYQYTNMNKKQKISQDQFWIAIEIRPPTLKELHH